MYNWNVQPVVDDMVATMETMQLTEEGRIRVRIEEFLRLVYSEMRNPGLAPEHRAMNFAAVNAFHRGPIFKDMAGQGMVLERSAARVISRPPTAGMSSSPSSTLPASPSMSARRPGDRRRCLGSARLFQ
ncbi:cyanobactin maturation protease PatG family protein [Azospirillum endophyticum]